MTPLYLDPEELLEVYYQGRDAQLALTPNDERQALLAGLAYVVKMYQPENRFRCQTAARRVSIAGAKRKPPPL